MKRNTKSEKKEVCYGHCLITEKVIFWKKFFLVCDEYIAQSFFRLCPFNHFKREHSVEFSTLDLFILSKTKSFHLCISIINANQRKTQLSFRRAWQYSEFVVFCVFDCHMPLLSQGEIIMFCL